MKKLSQSITILLLMLVFVGCSNDKEVSSSESSMNQSTSQPKIENVSKDLTLYEIFNIGEDSIIKGMVGFLMLEDNLDDITKDSIVSSVVTINYEKKEITTFIYKKGYSRLLSEFVNSDSWADVLNENEVSVYEFPQKDSDTST